MILNMILFLGLATSVRYATIMGKPLNHLYCFFRKYEKVVYSFKDY